MNSTVGDLTGNAAQIIDYARQAASHGASILLTPELSLTGYIPEDLLFRTDFQQAQQKALETVIAASRELKDLIIILGAALEDNDDLYNAAVLIKNGECRHYYKQALPNDSVFDEKRYFKKGKNDPDCFTVTVGGQKHNFAVLVCEDAWNEKVSRNFCSTHADTDTVLLLNASPYCMGKHASRLEAVKNLQQGQAKPNIFYCNMTGGQDEVVFDGHSFYVNSEGSCKTELSSFAAGIAFFDFDDQHWRLQPEPARSPELLRSAEDSIESEVWRGLVMGMRDYFQKNYFERAVLGLSGGIDSAVVLAIAEEALGAENITAVMMPSRFTADISVQDATKLAETLGVRYEQVAIEPMQEQFLQSLAPVFGDLPRDTTEENLQARIRGVLLMAIANKFKGLVLPTGNKSEFTTGYCTLYGDMVGAYSVLKDIPKTLVFRLAKWYNREREIIPNQIITRAPSAELAEDQKDEDSLPPYDTLDAIMKRLVENNASVAEIVTEGFEEEHVQKVARLLRINEYKRRQAAPGPKITPVAFGRERRYPITNRFKF